MNEADLIEAVKTGVIRGAVLDVVCHEPIAMDDPLLSVPGILITPHVSYASEESMLDLRRRAVENAWPCTGGSAPGPDPRVKAIKQYPRARTSCPGALFSLPPAASCGKMRPSQGLLCPFSREEII